MLVLKKNLKRIKKIIKSFSIIKIFYVLILLKVKLYYKNFPSRDLHKQKLRILLVYNKVDHHMAEFVNIALRKRFPKIEVYSAGPNNEYNIPDYYNSHVLIGNLAKKLQVDVIWEVESGFASLDFQFKRRLGNINIIKILWVNDSHQFLELMINKAKDFDHVFVSMKDDLHSFGDNASWLPGAASRDVAIDYHLTRKYDLTFIGSLDSVHQNRVDYLKRLSFYFPQINIKTKIYLESMARELSSSKIVFNMSLNKDLNYRVFESMACGALLITDRINNGLCELFIENFDIVIYDSFDDLKFKIEYYLKNSEERERIAKSGQFKVLKYHLVDNRIIDVLNKINNILSIKE